MLSPLLLFNQAVASNSSILLTATPQASLSFTISQSLFKLMSFESVISFQPLPTNLPSFATLCFFCILSFPGSGSFPMGQLFASNGQSIEASASALPVNIQGRFPLGLTGLISLLSKTLSTVFSNTAVLKHQFFGAQPFLWPNSYLCT